MDRRSELVLSKEGGEGRGGLRNISKGCDGFIDRSKVRILLCDNDSKSSDEVFKLLCGCAYQGIVVDTWFLFSKFVGLLYMWYRTFLLLIKIFALLCRYY